MATRAIFYLKAKPRGICLLLLQSDDGLPRLGRDVLLEISKHLPRFVSGGLDGIIVMGMPNAFAVGAEISEVAELDAIRATELSRLGQGVCRLIERLPVPVIAAIRGYCMGGGLDLALACHERIATADSVFAHPGGAIGIMTGWGGTQRLPRLIGRARALEMLTTGARISGQEAFKYGLVQRLVEEGELLPAAIARARQIGAHTARLPLPPHA